VGAAGLQATRWERVGLVVLAGAAEKANRPGEVERGRKMVAARKRVSESGSERKQFGDLGLVFARWAKMLALYFCPARASPLID
jgi:hypothetical protein